MTANIKEAISSNISYFIDSVLNGYSQIFFSTYKPFAILILLVTFIDVYTGLIGLLAVITTSATAFILNLDKPTIAKGLFGFNSLLVGLGLGIYYILSWQLLFIVILAAIFTLFISVSLQGVIGKYHLPYLSIPFLIGIWTFTIATKQFEALGISERGIYTMNELYVIGGNSLVRVYEFFNHAEIPVFIKTYLISLSAILFQYNVLAGLMLAVGLLLFSRITFTLSVLGFSIAYLFYLSIDANITMIEYSYIGFNYILTSIAVGGFFLIPSTRSYFSVTILVPLVAILTISMSTIFLNYNLAVYSLPFNAIVLLFLYILKFRINYQPKLSEVYYQYNSPEKNLYTFVNNRQRFHFLNYTPIKLPFMGAWKVSQGYDGEHTHQGHWRHAWDFIITNEKDLQYKNDGLSTEDYYCFNKPVTAPEDGTIVQVINHIEDNAIGEVNLESNWGNTVIIKHSEYVYSKLSHLKKDSVIVHIGDTVKAGQVIGKCGNSGRSPYPHLHYQLQATPYIGSATMPVPFSNYIRHEKNNLQFKSLETPAKGDVVSNIEPCKLMTEAFNFVPGQFLNFAVVGLEKVTEVKWELMINALNQTYFQCSQTGARAYFNSTGNLFYFTHYEGKKEDLLYYFYLALFKVQKSFYKNHELNDDIPLHQRFPATYLWFHDFISPFVMLAKSSFKLNYKYANEPLSPNHILLKSSSSNYFLNKQINQTNFDIEINNNGINKLIINEPQKTIVLSKISSYEV